METLAAPAPGLGPLPAAVRRASRVLSPGRQAVLDVLRGADEPLTLAGLAAATGRHENTVREHLSALVRLGVVARTRRPPDRRGRPAWLYHAAEQSTPPGPTEYGALATVLAGTLVSGVPDAAGLAFRAGTDWGRRLAAAQPAQQSAPRDRVVQMLGRFGFAPRRAADTAVIRLTRCPLLETARAFPGAVCEVHRGIACGALEAFGGQADGVALEAFAEPGACRLTLPT